MAAELFNTRAIAVFRDEIEKSPNIYSFPEITLVHEMF